MTSNPVMGISESRVVLGRHFEIQTEDLGCASRTIKTQVYCDGRVWLTRSSEYPSAAAGEISRSILAELVRRQHLETIRDLEKRAAAYLRASAGRRSQ